MLYARCFILLSWVLLILFTGGELEDIDGGYTEWSEWSRCDANCDVTGGHQYQRRSCTNPKPAGNGKTCEEQRLWPTYRSKECSLRPLRCGRELIALVVGLAVAIFVICVPIACYFIGSRPGKPRLTTPTSGEQPPPPYSRSGDDISLSTYPRELPSPPYSEEDPSPPYIRG